MRSNPSMLLAAVFLLTGSAAAQTVLLDNFNGNATGAAPAGWTLVTTGGTANVQGVPTATDKSVLLSKAATANAVSASRSFSPVSGKVAVELTIRTGETSSIKNVPVISSSNGTVAVSVLFNGNSISAYDGAALSSIQTSIASNTWYVIRVEMDTDTDKYDIYVDGVRKLTGASFRNAVSDIASVACSIDAGSSGTAYFDGLNIYQMRITPASGSYVALENFNSQAAGGAPSGWSTVTSGGTVTVQPIPFAGDKSLQFLKINSANAAMATKSFTATSGKATFEIKARSEDSSGIKNLLYINSSNGTKAVSVSFNGSSINVYNGGTNQSLVTFRTSTWYIVRVVLDTTTGKYDLYLDGIKTVSNGSFRNTVADVASVTCGIDVGYTGTAYVDNLKVYTPAGLIGSPPAPVFDAASYGAVGDGVTKNTTAIQAAIDACAGSGGSVYLHDGVFLTGTIQLKSGMTFFIDRSATLLGSGADADYPNQTVPLTGGAENIALQSKKALIYLRAASNVKIDGGGTIDGSGGSWPNTNGNEQLRPMLILSMMCNTLTIQNIYMDKAAMWCLVPVESNYLAFRNLNLYSDIYGNRDGIDLLDTKHVLVEDCTIRTDDDSICPKSGILTGLDDILVRNCYLTGSTRASGIKFGTRSYGTGKNMTFQDILIKNTDKSAMALESVDGSNISNVIFRRIDIAQTSSPFYLIIGSRSMTPTNDIARLGSIKNVLFEDITGRDLKYKIGSPISGSIINGVEYPISNLVFRRVNITYNGGRTTIPAIPAEMGSQYPECDIWGELPAYGYFLRHIDNVVFANCTTNVASSDARPVRTLVDVTALVDAGAADSTTLTITKLQYHPSAPTVAEQTAGFTNASDFAFVEVMNRGINSIDLDGVAFIQGINFTFSGTVLAPGQRALVVANQAAFEFRYGTSLNVAGVFAPGTDLSNAGSHIELVALNGIDIQNFTYASASPWPTSPNGGGRSLVVVRPSTQPDLNNAVSWRPSSSADGAPGVNDALLYTTWRSSSFNGPDSVDDNISGPSADPDRDGLLNLLEYARGTDPLTPNAATVPFETFTIEPFDAGAGVKDYAVIRCRYQPAAEDLSFTASYSSDLINWTAAPSLGTPVDNGDGTFTQAFRSEVPALEAPSRFLRINTAYAP